MIHYQKITCLKCNNNHLIKAGKSILGVQRYSGQNRSFNIYSMPNMNKALAESLTWSGVSHLIIPVAIKVLRLLDVQCLKISLQGISF